MISLIDLSKSFGPKQVLRGLCLEVEAGESHVVIGRSGEGKSVILKHICALMFADSGRIIVGGHEIGKDADAIRWIRKNVAMVFQMAALFDSLTVYENVGFYWLENGGKTKKEIARIVSELLDLVDLPNTEHLYPSELSGGMRKRVGLARSLAYQPQIVLYDEPTTGLDPVTSEVINELMIRASEHLKMTSVVITHDMKSAYSVADRISMLYEGQIIFTGTPKELRESEDPVVHQFIHGLAVGPITAGEDEQVQTRASMVINRAAILE